MTHEYNRYNMDEDYEKIFRSGDSQKMNFLANMMEDGMNRLKRYDKDSYNTYKMEVYELANGKSLTPEMAKKWVESMSPGGKWTMEQTNEIKRKHGITNISDVSFYAVMNMLYSDMRNILGDGESEESCEKYVKATKDWLEDPDGAEDKLYKYWKYMRNKE